MCKLAKFSTFRNDQFVLQILGEILNVKFNGKGFALTRSPERHNVGTLKRWL